uniref:formin-like protein 20 n=1 Tax=Solea senegalensis TaxID=28829 RepID=UPI001CD87A84|nr:formin-like protein 20 [Solea senegalensis]
MALGCLLWVSWICCLLFDGTGAGLHTKKGYRYPYNTDTRNLGNDGQDEEVSSLSFDDWQGSNTQPGAYPSKTKHSPAQQPAVVPTRRTMLNAPKVEGLVNGQPRDWGLENLNKPLTFPLKPKYQQQPDPVQPQSFNVAAPSNDMNASPSGGGAAQNEPYAEPDPYQAVKPPGFHWQPEPVPSGPAEASSPRQDSNTGTSEGEIPNLIYEELFDYPSENAAQSQSSSSTSETAGGNDQSRYVSPGSSTDYSSEPVVPSHPNLPSPGKGSSNSGRKNLNSGQVGYQPQKGRRPQQPAKKVVSQRVSEPILPPPPPPPPPRYIIQYRDGYQRYRQLLSKLKYSTEFDPIMPVGAAP